MATSIGQDGVYLDVNDAFLKRLGYEREEMVGRKPADFVTPESAKRIETELMPILRRTGSLEDKPVSFLTREGEVVNCLTNSLVENDPSGNFLRTVALYTELVDKAWENTKYPTTG